MAPTPGSEPRMFADTEALGEGMKRATAAMKKFVEAIGGPRRGTLDLLKSPVTGRIEPRVINFAGGAAWFTSPSTMAPI